MKKAVAYARVSTKSDAQVHSYAYQNEYWETAISSNPDYKFCGIYADQGISGRAVNKRPQFLKMMEDAKNHKFDIVFTKSVARFGRNTEKLLSMVRELRDEGIKVIFEKEQIDTFDPDAELFLTVAAAVAENDLRIYSENQRWAIRKKFGDGYISIGNKILGYRMNKETNTLEIEPNEAETVKEIFSLYLSGMGIVAVAKKLTELGRYNIQGTTVWNKGSIRYILSNEKYMGCALAQKTVTYFGECKINKNEVPQYFMEDTHEPIISKEDFNRVQKLLYARTAKPLIGKEKPTYPFSGMIVCGNCGKTYVHKINNVGKAWETPIWICYTKAQAGMVKCANTSIKDSVLKDKFVECYNEFVNQRYTGVSEQTMNERLDRLLEQEQELNALKVNRLIELAEYRAEMDDIKQEILTLKNEIAKSKARKIAKSEYKQITEFDENKVERFIEKVTIHPGVVTFTFINGVSLSRPYSNGQPGNQTGWQDKKRRREEVNANGNR